MTETGDGGNVQQSGLVVDGLIRRYASDVCVGPISFAVKEGEFFSLLGPSGCGKTTTLRCVAGFERADAGSILLHGRRIEHVPPHKRGIGLVFQTPALFPHLTVAENIAFGLETHRVPKVEIGRRVEAILDLIGLPALGNRMPTQISGGQQQRVALARSLVLEPPLLLLDEPLSSLDLKLRVQMREELRQLQQRLRKTTVFVTHDQTEALALSDRIAVLSQGRIEQIGTPQEIYSSPASRFVADFIGNSNLVDARVLGFSDGIAEIETASGLRIKVRCGTRPPEPEVTALIRPEFVRLDGMDGQAFDNLFSAVVRDVTYLGPDTQYRLVVEQKEPLLAIARTGDGSASVLAQGRVHVRIEAGDVVLLKR